MIKSGRSKVNLQERLRAAPCGNRELDAEVCWCLTPAWPVAGSGHPAVADAERSGVEVFDSLFPGWRGRSDIVPRYTQSLDAALGLAGDLGEEALRDALSYNARTACPLSAGLALEVTGFLISYVQALELGVGDYPGAPAG